MKLTDRLKSISKEAAEIKRSMTILDPRNSGFTPAFESEGYRRQMGQARLEAVAECAGLLNDVYRGRRPMWHLKEAMSTSDFPLLFGDVLYRQMLGNYAPYPVTYPSYCRIMDVNDFRNLNLYTLEGGTAALTEKIGEREPYPEIKFAEGHYSLAVGKYGRRYGISFEMGVNDDLHAFQQRPMVMAQGARRGEDFLATKLMFDANGPHASFYTAGNKNIITGNPVLSQASLQAAFTQIASQVDSEGEPIMITMYTLVVPPALEVTANNMVNALQVWIKEQGGTSNQELHINNWLASRFTVVVNPYIPIVATAGTTGTKSWTLTASPTDLTNRPAFMFGFLRGRRDPQLFMKEPNQRQLGGTADIMDGSFESDTIDYKLRHIFGASQGDPKMSVASNGSGS